MRLSDSGPYCKPSRKREAANTHGPRIGWLARLRCPLIREFKRSMKDGAAQLEDCEPAIHPIPAREGSVLAVLSREGPSIMRAPRHAFAKTRTQGNSHMWTTSDHLLPHCHSTHETWHLAMQAPFVHWKLARRGPAPPSACLTSTLKARGPACQTGRCAAASIDPPAHPTCPLCTAAWPVPLRRLTC